MMKKIFSVMSLALLMASCSNDDIVSDLNGNEAKVSFKVALNDAAVTRAISDGATVDELVWEVYDKNGKKVTAISGKKDAFANGATTDNITLTLAKGQTYTFGFWAQKKDKYVTTDLTRVELNYLTDGVAGNDEERDAFFAYTEPITVNGDFKEDITLKRPFAQLNLGVSDLEAFKAAGIELNQVEVSVQSVANNFDIKTGKVSGEVSAKFNLADVLCNGTENPTLTLKKGVGIKDAENKEVLSFPWISMNYLLVNDATTGAASDNVDITFTITTKNHDDIVLTSTNTPIQRNYRTNLIASLTNKGQFNLVIEPLYDGENNGILGEKPTTYGVKAGENYYETLTEALNAGETDIHLAAGEYELNVSPKNNVKITGASTEAKINFKTGLGMNSKNVTFENVTIVSKDVNYTGMTHGANVTFNGCVIEDQITCYSDGDNKTTFNNCTFNQTDADFYNIWTYGSNVDFNNCVFNSAGKAALVYAESSTEWKTVNFNDCKFNASAPVEGKAAIEIDSSLHPYNVNIKGCTAEGFGKGSVSGNTLFNLKKGEEGVNCKINVTLAEGAVYTNGEYQISTANGMFWLADQVNTAGETFAGKTVKLTADIKLNQQAWTPIGTSADGPNKFQGTFDGANKTISGLSVNRGAAYHAAGLFGALNGTVQNLVIDGASVENLSSGDATTNGTAVVAGSIYGFGLVKNVTVKNATVDANRYVGGIAGYVYGKIEGCTVESSAITAACDNLSGSWDNGDKVGGIGGYFPQDSDNYIKDCKVNNVKIQGYRDLGGIVGYAKDEVSGCTISEVTITVDITHDYKNYATAAEYDANSIVGEGGANATNCTGEATINRPVK